MSRNRNVTSENKLKAVQEYLSGQGSLETIAAKYGVATSSFRKWIAKYKAFGDEAFLRTNNNNYTQAFKRRVVDAYLNGEGSLRELSVKFKIPSWNTVKQWILKYNKSHDELKSYNSGGNLIMTTGRKTTYDERIEIVKHCIECQNNYAETAKKYNVSYQQVYSWCKKYEANGAGALQDKRGRKKSQEEMSEVEKLRAENKLLQARIRRSELENAFLKKLEELERRGY